MPGGQRGGQRGGQPGGQQEVGLVQVRQKERGESLFHFAAEGGLRIGTLCDVGRACVLQAPRRLETSEAKWSAAPSFIQAIPPRPTLPARLHEGSARV